MVKHKNEDDTAVAKLMDRVRELGGIEYAVKKCTPIKRKPLSF